MKKHYHVEISGQVQGVFYRDFIQQQARKLSLTGSVRNRRDGKVSIEVEGEPDRLEEFLVLCRQGSPLSQVEKVTTREGQLQGGHDFAITD